MVKEGINTSDRGKSVGSVRPSDETRMQGVGKECENLEPSIVGICGKYERNVVGNLYSGFHSNSPSYHDGAPYKCQTEC
jgi:hypothetical protein